eukprot:TRINITY_DN12322_c0_g1_i2.p1 TRINITY_DN12322_c0_g1~~TRINITY_DN12322_c0_g1_i2.p1  ORF type:complete len:439 (+),score=77.06 TRINITY_DN12322_c0_g1_i2:197-1513(+)
MRKKKAEQNNLREIKNSTVLFTGTRPVHGLAVSHWHIASSSQFPSGTHERGDLLRVWYRRASMQCVAILPARCAVPAPGNAAQAVCFSPDSELVAVGDGDRVNVYAMLEEVEAGEGHLQPRRMVTSVACDGDYVCAVRFCSSGKVLAAGAGSKVFLWEASDLEGEAAQAVVLEGHDDDVLSVALQPNMLVTGSADSTVRVWRGAGGTWECATVLEGHTDAVRCVDVAPMGGMIVSGSKDHTVRVWTAGGQCVAVLQGHTARVSDCSFSGAGRVLSTCSKDKSIRLWDMLSFKCIAVLNGHKQGVTACKLSADGKHFVSAGEDATVRTWDLTGLRLSELPWCVERLLWIEHLKPSKESSGFARLDSVTMRLVLGRVREYMAALTGPKGPAPLPEDTEATTHPGMLQMSVGRVQRLMSTTTAVNDTAENEALAEYNANTR